MNTFIEDKRKIFTFFFLSKITPKKFTNLPHRCYPLKATAIKLKNRLVWFSQLLWPFQRYCVQPMWSKIWDWALDTVCQVLNISISIILIEKDANLVTLLFSKMRCRCGCDYVRSWFNCHNQTHRFHTS